MSTETETGFEDGRKTIMRMMECIAEGNEEKADALITSYMTETARRMFTDGIQRMLSPADAERGAVDAGPLQLDPDNYDDGGEKAGFVPAPPDPTDRYVSDVPYARPAMTGDDEIDAAMADTEFGAEDIPTLDELDGIGGSAEDDVASFLGGRVGGGPTMAFEAADPSKGKGKSPDRSSKSDDLVKEISADADEIDSENRNGDVRESAGSAARRPRRPRNLKEGTHRDMLGTSTSYFGYGVEVEEDGTCAIYDGAGNNIGFEDNDDAAFDRCSCYSHVPSNFNGRGKPNHRKQVKEKWRGVPIVRVTYPDGSEETYGIGKEGSKPIELIGEKMFDTLDDARAHVDAAKRAEGVNESAAGKTPESYLFRRPAPGVLNEADGDNRDDEEIEKAERDLNDEMAGGQGDAARDEGPGQEDIGVGAEGGEEGQPQPDQGQAGQLDDGAEGGADGDPSNGEEEVTAQDVEERVETVAAVAEKVLDDAGALEDAIVEMRKAYEKNEESREADAAAAAQEPDPQDPDSPQGDQGDQGGDQIPEDGEQPEYGVGNQGGQQAQQDQDAESDNENFFHLPNEDGQGNGQNQGGRK